MVRSFGAAVAASPFSSELHFLYGKALLDVNCYGGARLHFEQAIHLNNDYFEAIEALRNLEKLNLSYEIMETYFVSWSDAAPPERKNIRECNKNDLVTKKIPILLNN